MRRRLSTLALGLLAALPLGTATAVPAAGPEQELARARALESEGRLDEALRAYAAAAKLAGAAHPAAHAVALNNSCLIRYRRGDLARAERECTEALEWRRLGDDPRGLGRTLNNLGLVLEAQGTFERARERFEEALAINRRRGDAEGQAINLGNLTRLALDRGAYGPALSHVEAAVEVIEAAGEAPWAPRQLAVARHNDAVVLEKLGLFHEAREAYRAVDPAHLTPVERATLQLNLGVVYRNLGDPHLALEAFSRAAGGQEDGGGRTRPEVYADLNAGIVLDRNLLRYEAAEQRYRRALAASREIGDTALELRVRLYLAELDLSRGRLEPAAAELAAIEPKARELDFAEGLWRARFGLGRVAVARGRPLEARLHFRRALAVVGTIRAQLASQPEGEGLPVELRPLYAAAVDNLADLAEATGSPQLAAEALQVAQRGKRPFDPLRRTAPPPDLSALRAALGDATLIEVFAGARDLYRWTVTASKLALARIGPFDPIADDVLSVHAALSHAAPAQRESLERLSRGLLGGLPARDLGRSRLYVATDGRLGYLPFEILVHPGAAGPLITRTAVVYLPTGAALVRPDGRREPELRFAGLANPDLDATPGSSPSRRLVDRFGLEPLPGAERGLARILRTMPAPRLGRTGSDATEEALRTLDGRGAAILHLGAHTVIDPGAGAEAAILLGPSAHHDGLVLPSEIVKLELPTRLTVLASCQTAVGLDPRSAALSELAGAFLVAGSGAVVATLWPVGDQQTEVFMRLFYDLLREGADPGSALRRVKQRLRRDPAWTADHHWSPYVLVGPATTPPLPAGEARPGLAALLLAALALLAGIRLLGEGLLRGARTR